MQLNVVRALLEPGMVDKMSTEALEELSSLCQRADEILREAGVPAPTSGP